MRVPRSLKDLSVAVGRISGPLPQELVEYLARVSWLPASG